MRRVTTIMLFAMVSFGCVSATVQMQRVETIRPGGGGGENSSKGFLGGLFGGSDKEGAAVNPQEPKSEGQYGSWFARWVEKPAASDKKLTALEIIWCDTGASDFRDCRVAIAWARNATGGLGTERGYRPVKVPPMPVGKASGQATQETTSWHARPAVQTTPSEGATPAAEQSQLLVVKGKSYVDFDGFDIGKLRRWSGRTVELVSTYGKKVKGKLMVFDDVGVQLDFGISKPRYQWSEIDSLQGE